MSPGAQASPESVTTLAANLRNGSAGAEETAKAYLERIDRTDGSIGAFLDPMAETALSRTRSLDALAEEERGPLHGVPIAVKDIISVAGTPCTCGSRILEGYVPQFDATAVRRLLDAGAVILGKTNLDEFAMGSSTENSAFHVTRNPWNLDHVPGGSSGGSAAAVAARMVPSALGTDTGGSVRQPAALCGIVGLKPTYGRISRYGLVAFASSLDQIGPMTTCVEDQALLLEILAGADSRDATCATRPVPPFREAIRKNVSGLRIGVPRFASSDGLDREVRARFDGAIRTFESLGVEIEEVSLTASEHTVACYYLLATAEASSNLARYDGVRYGIRESGDETLHEMMAKTRSTGFGDEVKRRILLGTFVLSAGYYEAFYDKAQRVRTLIARDFENAFARVDAVLMPTTPTPAFRIGEKVRDPLAMYLTDVFTITANLTGSPAISLPGGFSDDSLPIGVQLLGRHFDEETLLSLGYAFQESTQFHRRRPEAPPSARK